MSNMLGLVELLLVFSAGLVWGLFELRSLRRSRKADDTPSRRPDGDEPPV